MFGKKQDAWLIVGLGNPGKEYAQTRHNCGWMAIDHIAEKLSCKIDKGKFQGLYGQAAFNGNKIFLLKPQTYMNASGQSVLQMTAYYQIPPERILVLFDDISLEPGRLRIRSDGSAGGHNGIKSIIASIGSEAFPRIKIGVGAKPHKDADLADWVLSGFSESEKKNLQFALENAADAALCIIEKGLYEAANRYNGSHP